MIKLPDKPWKDRDRDDVSIFAQIYWITDVLEKIVEHLNKEPKCNCGPYRAEPSDARYPSYWICPVHGPCQHPK